MRSFALFSFFFWSYYPIPWRDSISRPITPTAETIPLDHSARAFVVLSDPEFVWVLILHALNRVPVRPTPFLIIYLFLILTPYTTNATDTIFIMVSRCWKKTKGHVCPTHCFTSYSNQFGNGWQKLVKVLLTFFHRSKCARNKQTNFRANVSVCMWIAWNLNSEFCLFFSFLSLDKGKKTGIKLLFTASEHGSLDCEGWVSRTSLVTRVPLFWVHKVIIIIIICCHLVSSLPTWK
jgi:hypothetical protein